MDMTNFNHSFNMSDLLLERIAIEQHHRNSALIEPDSNDGRQLLDRPFAGIAILAGFFLLITLVICIFIFIFYKKRNTVFVYEKSVHRGLNSSLVDRSVVIGHAARARHLVGQYAEHSSDVGSFDEESTENDPCEDWELLQAPINALYPPVHGFCAKHAVYAAYSLRPHGELFANLQALQKQLPDAEENQAQSKQYRTESKDGKLIYSLTRCKQESQSTTILIPKHCTKHQQEIAMKKTRSSPTMPLKENTLADNEAQHANTSDATKKKRFKE